ncbi:LacI family transcriptional regulator [Arthrobacter sp. cf158]|uniref:LacI family DNA-binding transcriptional regulator n=1 Tax=Arthrobacter sp. cf158 TaxID=1761744 RepID=UPI00089BC048|nr:LacI family DNA-binding transcriptional regulator [Arthrobacter sp. cf158]SDW90390.1 LacI family transcriptional regulator [Arthrobacter sp. cf158]
MGKVAIGHVAEAAGVSKTTISNYFNAPEKISPAVRARIGVAIETLGYVRSDAARQLRAGRSTVIGYVVFEVGNTYFSDIAQAVEQRAAEAGLHVLIANNAADRKRERAYLDLFAAQQVRGVIVAPLDNIEPQLETLRKRGIPSVMTGRKAETSSQPSVSVDDALGGYLAAKHLIGRGCKSLAFVGGPLDLQQIHERLQGAAKAVGEAEDVVLEIHTVEERTVAAGRTAAAQLVNRPAAKIPDGIFAANDFLGIGLIDGIHKSTRLRVPNDIAVIGFDDLDVAASGAVPLTTMHTPPFDYGRAIVELLLSELGELPAPETRHIVFEPTLIQRASS